MPKDITGQRFGRLLAVEFVDYNEKKKDRWLFRCDCGTEKIMPAANVKWGGVRSCGCLHREKTASINKQNIKGKRFDRLVAVEETDRRDAAGSIIWRCICDCGAEAFYSVNALHNGKIHSCGCLYRNARAQCSAKRRDRVEDTQLSSLISAKKTRNDNKSGYTGVMQDKRNGRWMAYISFQKKRYFLGSFLELEEAVKARKLAEEALHDPVIKEHFSALGIQARRKLFSAISKEEADLLTGTEES